MFPSWFCNTSLPSTKSFLANTLPKVNSPYKAKLLQNLYHYSYLYIQLHIYFKRKVPKNWHLSQNPTGGVNFFTSNHHRDNNLQPKARWWCTWTPWRRWGVGVSSWWLNQPIWEKICNSQIGLLFPQVSKWKSKIFELPPPRFLLFQNRNPPFVEGIISCFCCCSVVFFRDGWICVQGYLDFS